MTGLTDAQRVLEMQAGRIIWEAASLTPGTPGHAGKTAKLVARMVALLREAQDEVRQPVSPVGQLSQPEPPGLQQLHSPGVDQAELERLRAAFAKPERRH